MQVSQLRRSGRFVGRSGISCCYLRKQPSVGWNAGPHIRVRALAGPNQDLAISCHLRKQPSLVLKAGPHIRVRALSGPNQWFGFTRFALSPMESWLVARR